MRRSLVLLGLLWIAACDSAQPLPTTSPPDQPSTTTTIVSDTCEELAKDTADYLDLVLRVLDDTTVDELRDPGQWSEALIAVQQQGHDLDLRAEAMRCDRGLLQERAFYLADLDPEGPLGAFLLDLLGR